MSNLAHLSSGLFLNELKITYFIHSFHFFYDFSDFKSLLNEFSLSNLYFSFEFLANEWIANVKKIYEYGRLPAALALSLAFLAT